MMKSSNIIKDIYDKGIEDSKKEMEISYIKYIRKRLSEEIGKDRDRYLHYKIKIKKEVSLDELMAGLNIVSIIVAILAIIVSFNDKIEKASLTIVLTAYIVLIGVVFLKFLPKQQKYKTLDIILEQIGKEEFDD